MNNQFRFYGTWNDSWGILDAILADGVYSLVLDLLYDRPEPLIVTRIDKATKNRILDGKRSGFLWSPRFSRWPPVMSRIDEGEARGKYCVHQAEGGPHLHLILPVCFEAGGEFRLGMGEFYCPNWTTAPASDIEIRPSLELLKEFKTIKALIKHQLARLKGHRGIWIGQEANRLVEEGRARIDGLG